MHFNLKIKINLFITEMTKFNFLNEFKFKMTVIFLNKFKFKMTVIFLNEFKFKMTVIFLNEFSKIIFKNVKTVE